MRDLSSIKHEAYERMYGEKLSDFLADALILKHKKTGARICLVASDDENKTFCIGFRTPPGNSTGVAHIIEHSVLNGSSKYPIKDPFMELAKGSLQTYLNAATFPDKTLYPVSSCNDKDLRNLTDVYMDAVFHPNIYRNEMIFRQEGWRYHLAEENDPLTLNGVVYSEMKGAFSDADGVFYRLTQCGLFPDTPYRYISGGLPEEIPNLSYEEFLDFHRRYYHPSNCYIYLYGDMDMEEYLDYLDREYLSHYDYRPIDSEIPLQEPRGILEGYMEYSLGEGEEEAENDYLGFGLLTGTDDPVFMTAFNAAAYSLFDAPAAPIKQALIDAGIGKDISSSVTANLRQPYFLLAVKGADAKRKDEFLSVLFREVERVLQEGINRKTILGYLVGGDFFVRESATDKTRRGLDLFSMILDSWIYNEQDAFRFCHPLARFQKVKELLDTGYFEQIIKETILSHRHELRLVLKGRRGLDEEREQKLFTKLQEYKASLSREEIEKLIRDTEALRVYQETPDSPEALACIPHLSVRDIRREAKQYPLSRSEAAGIPVLHYNTGTNGISYVSLYIDVTGLPAEELPYLGLYSSALLRVDTTKHAYGALNDEINLHVGSLYSSLDTFSSASDYRKFTGYEAHHVRMLYDEIPTALSFLAEMIVDTDFSDKKRLKEVIQEDLSNIRSGMVYNGNSVAKRCCLSSFQAQEYFSNQTNGMGQYEFLYDILDRFDERADEVIRHLNGVMAFVLDKKRITIAVTADEEGFRKTAECLPEFLEKLIPNEGVTVPAPAEKLPWEGGYPLSGKNQAISFGGQVNFAAQSGIYAAHGYKANGHLQVLSLIINREYLYQNIRVRGGAYGAGSGFAFLNGTYTISTYRDPNLGRSFEVFRGIPDFVRNLSLTDDEMEKYIIGTVGGTDRPKAPKDEAELAVNMYYTGVTPEENQKKRDELLDTTLEDLRAQADLVAAAIGEGHIACFGSEGSIKKEAALFDEVKNLR